jgi:hypothetical protein
MSLIDAFFLEPYAFATYIANRNDGQKGSGTLTDPWDGSTQQKFEAVMKRISDRLAADTGKAPCFVHGPCRRDLTRVEEWLFGKD